MLELDLKPWTTTRCHRAASCPRRKSYGKATLLNTAPLIVSNGEGRLASDGKSACLLSDHVFHSSIAFEANPFQNFVVGHEVELERDSPRLGVGLGIGHRDFEFHVAEVAPMKTLGYV